MFNKPARVLVPTENGDIGELETRLLQLGNNYE